MSDIITVLELVREEFQKKIALGAAVSGVADAVTTRDPKEAIIGVLSGAAGAAANELYKEYIKNAPPQAVAAGIAASIITRHTLRRVKNYLEKE